MKRTDVLGYAALGAALAATMTAEYGLAHACGFGEYVSGAVPAALDVYALRAFRSHRDVPVVVAALIIVNAVAHLVASNVITASMPVIIGVSAIAPLVLWRVHALHGAPTPVPVPVSVGFEPAAAQAIAITTDTPAGTPVPAVPAAPEPVVEHVHERVPVTLPWPEVRVPEPAAEPSPEPETPQPSTDTDTEGDAEYIALARDMRGPISLRRLMRELGIGQTRARRVLAALDTAAA